MQLINWLYFRYYLDQYRTRLVGIRIKIFELTFSCCQPLLHPFSFLQTCQACLQEMRVEGIKAEKGVLVHLVFPASPMSPFHWRCKKWSAFVFHRLLLRPHSHSCFAPGKKKLTISKDNGLIKGQSGAHLEGEGDGGLVDGRWVEQVLDYHLDVLVRPQSDLLHFHIICPICRLSLKRIVKVFFLVLVKFQQTLVPADFRNSLNFPIYPVTPRARYWNRPKSLSLTK